MEKLKPMTANEIVKALRYCSGAYPIDCEKCQIHGKVENCTEQKLMMIANDLIEQQQAEIKQLEKEWEEAVCTATEFESQVYELQAEIERLKAVRLVRCIQADEPFEVGKLYPVCGDNNGVHVIGVTEDGEPYDLMCHNYGDELWDVMKIIDGECLGAKFCAE